jgi:hypothetical protein
MATADDLINGSQLPQQDSVFLGNLEVPGLCTIKSASFLRKWDVREAYGASGANLIFQGEGTKRCELEVTLWEPIHFSQWEIFSKTILFAKAIGPAGIQALDISHPILDLVQLHSVVVEEVTAFDQGDSGGKFTCTIKLIEFRPPVPALSKPTTSIPNAAAPVPTAVDAADEEQKKLIAQVITLAPIP